MRNEFDGDYGDEYVYNYHYRTKRMNIIISDCLIDEFGSGGITVLVLVMMYCDNQFLHGTSSILDNKKL